MRIKTLLVEDSLADARMIQESLRHGEGLQIIVKHTDCLGRALEALMAEKPDAVILDLSLPDSKGLATFRSIQGQTDGVPIVVLTGLDDVDLAVQTIGEGAADYLVKDELSGALLLRAVRYGIERKRAEESLRIALRQKEVLLQELHHRVKNNLQIVSSLLNMQADSLPEEFQKVFDESQRRVRSMALVHEQLYRGGQPDQLDLAEYAMSLSSDLLAALNVDSGAVRLRFDTEPVLLGLGQAISCGLILNELVTNSVKYAFRGGQTGEILVALHSSEDRVTLRVADDGVGLPPGFDWKQSNSLGLRIINILTLQLNGTLECPSGHGADFTLTFVKQLAPHSTSAPNAG